LDLAGLKKPELEDKNRDSKYLPLSLMVGDI